MPSARFGDKILLASAKQIGPKVLAKAVQNEVRSLVAGGYVMDGLYMNTSLRKGLTDRLASDCSCTSCSWPFQLQKWQNFLSFPRHTQSEHLLEFVEADKHTEKKWFAAF